MIASRLRIWIGSWAIVCAILPGSSASHAADCPEHPDAIGTSRTLVVDPHEHPRIGTMQYPETLPLRDHEVVLTFDDGPLPRNSNQALKILAENCVKATFFLIGQQSLANPDGVRKLVEAGHSFGTHSQTHPLTFEKMPLEKAQQQIDNGIASATAALRDPSALAPFFRFPGLLRNAAAEQYLASRGIQVWSTDFLADDWHRISPARIVDLAIKRLEEHGKGILLLHDIQARTVAALPKLLQEMKARGYRIVHVVPASAQQPPDPTDPLDWQMHPPSETVPIAHWPKVPTFVFAETPPLASPARSDFDMPGGQILFSPEPFERMKQRGMARPEAPWPRVAALSVADTSVTLSAPESSLFEMPERAVFRSPPPRIARVWLEESTQQRLKPGYAVAGRKSGMRAVHGHAYAATPGQKAHAVPKHHAQANAPARRPVRVASLKNVKQASHGAKER